MKSILLVQHCQPDYHVREMAGGCTDALKSPPG